MQIVEKMKKQEEKEQKSNDIDKMVTYAKNSLEREYANFCNHDIVLKIYGSHHAENRMEPDYYCLGCGRYFRNSEMLEEENENIFIIDLTNLGVRGYVGTKNVILSYIQYLAFETSLRIPEYDDADFVEMIEQNKEFIKIPEGFKPKDVNLH